MDWTTILAGTKEISQAAMAFLGKGFTLLLGIYFIGSGLHKMYAQAKGHRQGESTFMPVMINLLVGSIMIQFYSMVDRTIFTLFGEEQTASSSVLEYMPKNVAESQMLSDMVQVAVLWVGLIGLVAICKGLVLVNDLSNGRQATQGAGWKAFWHIVFGAAAVNIVGVVKLFS